MSVTYKITLSDAQNKALGVVSTSQLEWIKNMSIQRANLAIEEIVQLEVQRLLAEGKPITGTKDDIVLAAPIESAAEREVRLRKEFEESQKEQQG